MIISFLNQKGGVGKTTLAINVASCLAKMDNKVLLVDADAQRSSLDWAAIRESDVDFTVIGLDKAIIHKQIAAIRKGYDYVIIDGPPRIYDVARSAIASSDVVIIPVQPSPYDIWSAEEIVKLVREVAEPMQDFKKIQPYFLINRKISNTAIGRDVIEALKQYNIDLLKTHVHQRVAYAETAARGGSIFDSTDDKAINEITNLTKEIVSLI